MKKHYGSDKVIIKNNVTPLTIRKNEHTMWLKSDYKAIAFIDNCSNHLKKILKTMLIEILKDNSYLYFIAWGSDEITMNNIKKIFDNNIFIETYPLTGNFLVKPGAVIICLRYPKDNINQIEYWGTLDRLQIIVPLTSKEDDIKQIICTDTYIYNRHGFEVLNKLMKYAKIVVNDTGDGEEFELIFHKKNEQEMTSFTEKILI